MGWLTQGFFLLVCPEGTSRIAKFAYENDRPFCFNISALYISQFFKKELTQILPYVDVLFGNEEEMASFAKNVLNVQVTHCPRPKPPQRMNLTNSPPGHSLTDD